MSRRDRIVRRWGVPFLVVASLVAGLVVSAGPASALTITSAGPLTNITISPDLNCAVNHTGDTLGEFFGDTACGTLIAVGGTLYGPAVIPAGSAASPRTGYTPVSQLTAGSGTAADPFTVVTVVDAGTSGVRLTQTDSYVTGQESYRTDVRVTNTTASPVSAVLYKAGDCFLQNNDLGFGAFDAATGAVSCVAGTVAGETTVRGTRIEQFFPLTAGSTYLEDAFYNVWAAVGTRQPLANQCAQCAAYIDNGMALSWSLNIAAGSTTSVSHITTFSPLGIVPLTMAKTADSATATAGGPDGYTITVRNTNATPVALDSIVDSLPAGFRYTVGSSTGATTSDPTVTGQDLRWAGPLTVPAGGSLSLHFAVTVAPTAGQYLNNASATSSTLAVAPTGPTASITVSSSTTPPPVTGTPGYRLVAEDGGIFTFGSLGFYGSTGGVLPKEEAVGMADTPSKHGYWIVLSNGGVLPFGDARSFGSLRGVPHRGQVVGMAATPTGNGYWLAASDGGVYSFGDAPFRGSLGAAPLNKPIVGIAATPSGHGYWLVASDGGVFSFGDAAFHGSTGGFRLNKPIVGIAATPSGNGYWLVASDGGIFSFGDAAFHGSTGGFRLNKPIVGIAATPSGNGYWLVASDGGIFAFGDAPFLGSTGGFRLNKPIVGVAATASGNGYWLVASDGGIFAFGDAPFLGSTGGAPLFRPIVGMAA